VTQLFTETLSLDIYFGTKMAAVCPDMVNAEVHMLSIEVDTIFFRAGATHLSTVDMLAGAESTC
jgi:hypothetical protein